MNQKGIIAEDAIKRIWPDDGFRVFLSHKTEVKTETAELKDRLKEYGITCFVAHEDIHPNELWQAEIENALATMDSLVALMTENFHDSDWTDQEIGYAVARSVPILAVRLGKDPYGFIGKFQALTATWAEAPKEILKTLCKKPSFLPTYIRSMKNCTSWTDANNLAECFQFFNSLSETQVDELIDVYNLNSELAGSYGFNGEKPHLFGSGLVHFLNQWSSRTFHFDSECYIKQSGAREGKS